MSTKELSSKRLADLKHKARQYDDVVAALRVADGGRYRADTISSVLGAISEANQRIAELEALVREKQDCLDWHARELSQATKDLEIKHAKKEAAEAKLAAARSILSESDPNVAQMEVLDRLTVAIRRMQRAYDALARIEQPQDGYYRGS